MTNVPIVSRSGQQHLLYAPNVNVNVNINGYHLLPVNPFTCEMFQTGFFVCFFDKLNQFQKGLDIYV